MPNPLDSLRDLPLKARDFLGNQNPRDLLRLGLGSLLALVGAYRLLVTLILLFSAAVDLGSQSDRYLQIGFQALGPLSLGIFALAAGLGIFFRKARGTCAVLCAIGFVSEAISIYAAFWHARIFEESESLAQLPSLKFYLIIFLAGLAYLFLPQRRSILASPANGGPITLNDTNWNEWLLASLRDTGVEAPHDRFMQAALGFVAYLVLAVVIVVIGRFVIPAVPILGIFWIIFVVAVLARLRNASLRRMWQARARSADEELQRAGSRHPVLYLRSFNLDAQIATPNLVELFLGTTPLADAEQIVTKELRKCGPVIAIGRPGEALPQLGAARFYVSHQRWKEKVADVVRVSELVVWATGATDGLRWEIGHLIEALPFDKLVLWAHPHLLRVGEAEREAEWTRFRKVLGGLFPHPLPQRLGDARFFYFTAQGEPIAVAPAGIGNKQRSALRALLRAKDYPKHDPIATARTRRRWIIGGATVVAIWVAIGAAIAIANHLHVQHEQAQRDAEAWDRMAFYLYYNEGAAGVAGHPDQVLESMKGQPDIVTMDLSPARKAEVLPVVNDYVQIFAVAHQYSEVEPLLFNTDQSLLVGVTTLGEAKKRRANVGAVLDAFAKFKGEWDQARSTEEKLGFPLMGRGDRFDKIFDARANLLTAEAAILQFLIDHPTGWSARQDTSGLSLPAYADQATQEEFGKTLETRDMAAAALRALLPK